MLSYEARYQRSYRKRNAEKAMMWRINAAIALLTRFGVAVVLPENMDELVKGAI